VLAASACVTTYEQPSAVDGQPLPAFGAPPVRPVFAVPVAIPIAGGDGNRGSPAVAELYRGVLQRMHEAAKERDVGQIEALLANYERQDLPDDLRQRLVGYRLLAHGLQWTRHAAQRATLVERRVDAVAPPRESGAPALGAPLHLELQLPAGPQAVMLGGRDDADPIGFLVAVRVEDAFVEGSSRSSDTEEFVLQATAVNLAGDAVLRLPIDVDLDGGTAVRRDVFVRVDLMPGHVTLPAGRVPVTQTALAAIAITQWPVGYEAVAKAPLAELRRALQDFTPATFARGWLAAAAVRGDDRQAAFAALIDVVRFGRADQAQVAMAALRQASGVALPIGDREAWLAWFAERR